MKERKFKDGDHVVIVFPESISYGKEGYLKVSNYGTYRIFDESNYLLGQFAKDSSLEFSNLHNSPLMKALK